MLKLELKNRNSIVEEPVYGSLKVPTNRRGEIIQPVDTDRIVLGICNKDLGFKLDIHHIERSHPPHW